jgi:hypothetical protein
MGNEEIHDNPKINEHIYEICFVTESWEYIMKAYRLE